MRRYRRDFPTQGDPFIEQIARDEDDVREGRGRHGEGVEVSSLSKPVQQKPGGISDHETSEVNGSSDQTSGESPLRREVRKVREEAESKLTPHQRELIRLLKKSRR